MLLLLAGGAATASAEPRTSGLWWLPNVASRAGKDIDGLLHFIFWLTTLVFVLTQVVKVYLQIKYRARPGVKATYSHGNNRLEFIWTAIPTMIFIGLWGYGNHLWWDVIHSEPPADALEVGVTGYQFAFGFQYPGADGKLGRTDVKLLTNENLFANDRDDPASKDNFTSSVLELPVNKPVRIRLNSKDVIHAFYVPEFRIYQDAVPGRTIDWVWFVPTKIGSYQLACNQLCGSGHYNMKAAIQVVSQEEYDKWFHDKTAVVALSAPQNPVYAANP